MRKIVLLILTVSFLTPLMAQKEATIDKKPSSVDQVIKLLPPTKEGGGSLYAALNKRQTRRTFSEKSLSDQQLSDLLWCANGVNRADGKRTAPSARNAQEIDIYVFLPQGVYFYNAVNNTLELRFADDHRSIISDYSKMPVEAPVSLLFVANYSKMEKFNEEGREFYGATDAGFVSQNVYLYCAANNLSTVVMGAINRDALRDLLQFDGKAILAQPVGFPTK